MENPLDGQNCLEYCKLTRYREFCRCAPAPTKIPDGVVFLFALHRTYSTISAYSAPSAGFELSWLVNFHRPYFEVKFMDQSKSVPAGETTGNRNTGPTKNIVDTAIAAPNFSMFAAAVKAAGLTDVLAAKGPFTVFAPTDEAFKKLARGAWDGLLKDSSKLKAVLNYHIVSGYFMTRDVKSGEVMTLQGSTLTAAVSPAEVRVNGAVVTQPDLAATNGIVHAIDAVILPQNWQLLALAA
jgi:uncharacterized surface protein with fasciclin (FAS1) repeats